MVPLNILQGIRIRFLSLLYTKIRYFVQYIQLLNNNKQLLNNDKI